MRCSRLLTATYNINSQHLGPSVILSHWPDDFQCFVRSAV